MNQVLFLNNKPNIVKFVNLKIIFLTLTYDDILSIIIFSLIRNLENWVINPIWYSTINMALVLPLNFCKIVDVPQIQPKKRWNRK